MELFWPFWIIVLLLLVVLPLGWGYGQGWGHPRPTYGRRGPHDADQAAMAGWGCLADLLYITVLILVIVLILAFLT